MGMSEKVNQIEGIVRDVEYAISTKFEVSGITIITFEDGRIRLFPMLCEETIYTGEINIIYYTKDNYIYEVEVLERAR